MTIVVSDTSPLRALALLDLLRLLDELFEAVYVPPAVRAELAVVATNAPIVNLTNLRCIRFAEPKLSASALRVQGSQLGAGESEAIALCIELGADGLLMDDYEARVAAEKIGLKSTGVLAVLLRAKERGLIGPISPLCSRLVAEMKFRVSKKLLHALLVSAGEA